MLYTRNGDDGKTSTFGCDLPAPPAQTGQAGQRISKSSAIAEALGALDETNSFLGLCKVSSNKAGFLLGGESFAQIVHELQQTLFIVQAELAGCQKTVDEEKVKYAEFITDTIEKILPPIKSFFISGGSELGAMFDTARTIARRAERRVVAVAEEKSVKVGPNTLVYMNRLSSVLYALARLSNHLSGINEESPNYK